MHRRIVLLLACLLSAAPNAAAVNVEIDPARERRPINPLIYGVNFGSAAQLADPGYTLRRWGGNATSRYNFQADVHNTASDYYFMNIADGDGVDLPNGSSLNRFITETLAAGAQPIVTIGTLGWTPLPIREKRWGFSIAKYGAQSSDECRLYGPNPPFWCTADAGNGECGSGPRCSAGKIVGNDPSDTSFASDASFAADWVRHLQARHGGRVRYFALDNEPMLWNSTHRDVHPAPASYQEIWQKTVAYATAIKAVEPQAKLLGPVTWGYCDLFGSAADNCVDGADRRAHDGLPFVRWYLRQVCVHQRTTGLRLIDYLDLHYYPQGADVVDFGNNLANSESASASARRLRSLKELYDTNWTAESWLADLGDFDANHYSKPQLLRRVRAWIDAECPGTGLALTEYQWGADSGASSALAQAELLAIFGREGVDLATRWVAPAAGSAVERAFGLYLNYDGAGSRVVGDSIHAASADVDALGAYAVQGTDGRLLVLLFNKALTTTSAELRFAAAQNGAWQLYRLGSASRPDRVGNGTLDGRGLNLAALPPRSANLLVLAGSAAALFANGFE